MCTAASRARNSFDLRTPYGGELWDPLRHDEPSADAQAAIEATRLPGVKPDVALQMILLAIHGGRMNAHPDAYQELTAQSEPDPTRMEKRRSQSSSRMTRTVNMKIVNVTWATDPGNR
jgi:hypothetical protein